jgi:hypothetical protein
MLAYKLKSAVPTINRLMDAGVEVVAPVVQDREAVPAYAGTVFLICKPICKPLYTLCS